MRSSKEPIVVTHSQLAKALLAALDRGDIPASPQPGRHQAGQPSALTCQAHISPGMRSLHLTLPATGQQPDLARAWFNAVRPHLDPHWTLQVTAQTDGPVPRTVTVWGRT
ncbi:hypothetical protein [Nonomuraea sp. NPDC049400]|uniref:hypothetical protein n=1 Tax=Nonomuraea sp. NPDC049400 TaxID=3364352 RepID=UPI0037B87B1B